MARRDRVRTPDGMDVVGASTWEAAMAEACRRLTVMHQKWPETPWRMIVRKDPGRPWPWRVRCRVAD